MLGAYGHHYGQPAMPTHADYLLVIQHLQRLRDTIPISIDDFLVDQFLHRVRFTHTLLWFNAHSWGPSPTHGIGPFPFVFGFRATLLFAPVCLRLGIGICLLTRWCYVTLMMNITLALMAPSFKHYPTIGLKVSLSGDLPSTAQNIVRTKQPHADICSTHMHWHTLCCKRKLTAITHGAFCVRAAPFAPCAVCYCASKPCPILVTKTSAKFYATVQLSVAPPTPGELATANTVRTACYVECWTKERS